MLLNAKARMARLSPVTGFYVVFKAWNLYALGITRTKAQAAPKGKHQADRTDLPRLAAFGTRTNANAYTNSTLIYQSIAPLRSRGAEALEDEAA